MIHRRHPFDDGDGLVDAPLQVLETWPSNMALTASLSFKLSLWRRRRRETFMVAGSPEREVKRVPYLWSILHHQDSVGDTRVFAAHGESPGKHRSCRSERLTSSPFTLKRPNLNLAQTVNATGSSPPSG